MKTKTKPKQILKLYNDYLQACSKCPNSAAFYESNGGYINSTSILLGEVSESEVLDMIKGSKTLWKLGYHEYLSVKTKSKLKL